MSLTEPLSFVTLIAQQYISNSSLFSEDNFVVIEPKSVY